MFSKLTKFAKSIKSGAIGTLSNALDNFRQSELAMYTMDAVNNDLKRFSLNSHAENIKPAEPAQADTYHPYNRDIRDVASVTAEDVYENMRQYDIKKFYRNSPEWGDLPSSEQNKYVALMDNISNGRNPIKYDPSQSLQESSRNSFLYESANKAIDNFYFEERAKERDFNTLKHAFPRNSSEQVIDIASKAAYENLCRYDQKYMNINAPHWDQLNDDQKNHMKDIVRQYDNDQEPLNIGVDENYSARNPRERMMAFRSMTLQALESAQTGNYEQTYKNVAHFYDEKRKREDGLKTAARATYDVMSDLDKKLYKLEPRKWDDLSPGVQDEYIRRVDVASRGIDPLDRKYLGSGPQVIARALGRNVDSFEYAREDKKLDYFKQVAEKAVQVANKDNFDNVSNYLSNFHKNYAAPNMGHYFYDHVIEQEKEHDAAGERKKYENLNEAATRMFSEESVKSLMITDDFGI